MTDKILVIISLLAVIAFCGTVVVYVAEPDLMIVTVLVLLMAGYEFWSEVFRKKNGNGDNNNDSTK
ncbi:MAG: hypothetical protein ACR2PO_13655 [Methyloligellaceae bacterium]